MSYFMTTAGPKVDFQRLRPTELVPLAEAQDYLRELSAKFSTEDGALLYLVHDGESQTSHDLVCPAINAAIADEALDQTLLFKVLSVLEDAGHTVRIWDAGLVNPAKSDPEQCDSAAGIARLFQGKLSRLSPLYIRARLTRRDRADGAQAARQLR